MNTDHMETVSGAIQDRVNDLLEREGELGRLALAVENASRSMVLLAKYSQLDPYVSRALGEMVIEGLVLAIGSEPNPRFAQVHKEAAQILEDAETAVGSLRGLDDKVRDILKGVK
jgi:hypothetical protein